MLGGGCLECVVRLFELYFTCAVTCTRDATDVDCIDCAYTYASRAAQSTSPNLQPHSLD